MHIDYIICLVKLFLISNFLNISNKYNSQNLYVCALFDCTRMQLIPVFNSRR